MIFGSIVVGIRIVALFVLFVFLDLVLFELSFYVFFSQGAVD